MQFSRTTISRTLGFALMLFAALGIGSLRPARAQIQDGSFEENVASGTFYGGQTFGGWTVGAGSIDLVPARTWQAEDGNLSIDLSGDTAGSIYQDVPTVAGQTYQLSFYMAGNPYDQPALKSLNVLANTTQIGHFTFSTAGTTVAAMGWRLMQATFTATSATTRITFQSLNNGPVGPTLDNISLSSLTVASPVHTHLLWNNTDGRIMLWSIAQDGSYTLNGFGPYTDGARQNTWTATAVATGPDGKSHLLWNNADGRVMLWTVDDQGNFTYAGFGPYTDNSVGSDPSVNKWSATAVSVGADNVVHLLWNNTDHRVMLWNVASDFTFTLAGYGPYTDNSVSTDPNNFWSATALATGPDNKSRIVWNNADGRVMLWNVAPDFSFTLAGYGPYTDGAAQNQWSAVGASVGPDNVTHLLWANTDHRAMLWNVPSDFSFTLAGFGPYTDNAPANLWSAASLATGPDGLSHLLWGNPDNRAMLWGVNSSFNFTVAGYGPYTDNWPGNLWSATAVSAGP